MSPLRDGARTSTMLVAWNVRGFRPRAHEVDDLFTNEAVSLAFLSETMQATRKDGTVVPLDFIGTRISMPGVKELGTAGHASMGIAFVSKTISLKRIASLQCPHARWQMLVVETDRLRIIGVYIRPKTQRPDWLQLLARVRQYTANIRPTIVCGDFNAHHPEWTTGKADAGGSCLRTLTCKDSAGLPGRNGTRFAMNAPAEPTCVRPTPNGLSKSTIDLFLVANLRNFTMSKTSVYLSQKVGGSDHVPIALTVTAPPTPQLRPTRQFLPTPYRRSKPLLRAAALNRYEEDLPGFTKRFQQCKDEVQLRDAYADFLAMVQAPWMTMAAPKPARFRPGWTRQLDAIAKERAKQSSIQFGRDVSPSDRKQAMTEARRLTSVIRRLLKHQRHIDRETAAKGLRNAAENRDAAGVARILRRQTQAEADPGQGEALKPADFTEFFASKPRPDGPVPLRHFALPEAFRESLCRAIRKAKTGKAPGPDGIPVDIYKMLPDRFADAFFALFAACGRLAAVVPGWDLSVLIPIYKRKGLASDPANYRPLRLIPALKKVFGIALDATLRKEIQNEPAQYGFQTGTSSLEALVLAIADTQRPGLITIAVDQKGAYDTVNRAFLMKLIDARTSESTAAMVAMVVQPSHVYTKGDETRTIRTLDVGLTQGGNESPSLFNVPADKLMRMIASAVEKSLTPLDPAPAKAFADDLLLQLLRLLDAKRALAACSRWASETGQTFTVAKGKSGSLRRDGDLIDMGLKVNDKCILQTEVFEYLGVTLTATGPTDASLNRRVGAASKAMIKLRAANVLVRGMNVRHAYNLYNTFVVSRWTYAAFLQPLTSTTEFRLNSIDAAFISSILVACRAIGTGRRRSMLPTLRALLRIPSPALRRKCLAHRYTARLLSMCQDKSVPALARKRARAALEALPQVPAFLGLVPDLAHPWGPEQETAARADEWRRAGMRTKRPVPDPTPGAYYPPAVHLHDPWAKALAARYHCATFPILTRTVARQGPRRPNGRPVPPLHERAQLTPQEKSALADLSLLHRSTCTPAELATITQALRALRPREKWARQPRSPQN